MKVLVFAHRLELGGTQTNAIELAAAVRDRFGHEVVLFAIPGPAAALAEGHGLRVIPAPDTGRRPSRGMMAALVHAAAAEGADLVHAWDWPQVLDAYLGLAARGKGPPVLGTSMSMAVERFLPRTLPMTFGTEELAARAAAVWRAPVVTLEPPVDTTANAPGTVDGAGFRRRFGLSHDLPGAVIVSRLSRTLKLEGVLRSVDAVGRVPVPFRLVVVGDGDARPAVEASAAAVNRRLGRDAVVVAGPMVDPRPAYAGSDVVLGMGGSALRAMAFARPLIVLGEQGFSEVFEPRTAARFLRNGFYGLSGPDALARQLAGLLEAPSRRQELGAYGRAVVAERFALPPTAARLEAWYRRVAEAAPSSRRVRVMEGARSLAIRSGGPLIHRARPRAAA